MNQPATLSPTAARAAKTPTEYSTMQTSTTGQTAPTTEVRQLVEQTLEQLHPQRLLISTYRLQFQGAAMRFSDAEQIAAYLKTLGVSHVYASPLLKAKSGSTHGYDVVNPTQLNDELGTQEDFNRLVHTLHEQGLGQLLDIVPNHMSVANDENQWWMDVLRHGPASRYADFFNIA